MLGGVAGRGDGGEPRDGLAVRRPGWRDAEPLDPREVVGVIVGEQDSPDPAARLRGLAHPRDVSLVVRARVDHHSGVAPYDIRVRPLQRHRTRIGGDQALDLDRLCHAADSHGSRSSWCCG